MILLWEIVPQDAVAVAGEILVLFRRCSDWRHEHRGQKSRHEGEHRRVRPAGPVAHQKSLLPDDRCKCIDSSMSLIASSFCSAGVWRPNPCNFNVFSTLRRTRPGTISRSGSGSDLKNWAGPLTKLTSSSQRVAIRAR